MLKITKRNFDKHREVIAGVIEVIISAGLERVASEADRLEKDARSAAYVTGVVETTGRALAALYSQITGEGMEPLGALRACTGLDRVISDPVVTDLLRDHPAQLGRWVGMFLSEIEDNLRP
jgi:hypothetical protein